MANAKTVEIFTKEIVTTQITTFRKSNAKYLEMRAVDLSSLPEEMRKKIALDFVTANATRTAIPRANILRAVRKLMKSLALTNPEKFVILATQLASQFPSDVETASKLFGSLDPSDNEGSEESESSEVTIATTEVA